MPLSNPPVFPSRRGKPAHFAVLVHGGADPVYPGVPADCGMGGVDEDDFEEFEGRVLKAKRV